MDQFVLRKSLDHKQGKVHTARNVALKNRIADVPAPYWQALALPFFEGASTHDGPAAVAREYSPTRFDLVVEICNADKPCEAPKRLHERFVGAVYWFVYLRTRSK
jgi:hypothetical protein